MGLALCHSVLFAASYRNEKIKDDCDRGERKGHEGRNNQRGHKYILTSGCLRTKKSR